MVAAAGTAFFTALWGVRALLGGLGGLRGGTVAGAGAAHESRGGYQARAGHPRRVRRGRWLTPVALGLSPRWHIDVQLPPGRRRHSTSVVRPTAYGLPDRHSQNRGRRRCLIEMHEAFHVGDTCEFEGPCNAFHLGLAERDAFDRRYR